MQAVLAALHHSSDLIVREFDADMGEKKRVAVLFIEGLVNIAEINERIIHTLMFRMTNYEKVSWTDSSNCPQLPLPVASLLLVQDIQSLTGSILRGQAVILLDGWQTAFAADTGDIEDRGVEKPTSQTVIRGPQEGFTETLQTNLALIRKRLSSADLIVTKQELGHVTQTKVSVVYLKDTADRDVVQEVFRRLGRIDLDGVLEGSYIEEFIQDSKYSPFPTVLNTERPDTTVAGLLEGKVVILVDGSPFVLLVPCLFDTFLHSAEDHYKRWTYILTRPMRFVSYFYSLLAPALYIAITTFHQEVLPPPLLISLSAQREGVPFPAFFEALIMIAAFELLNEAGVRMPRAVGSAISIVGAIVLGQAAVEAGFVSAAMVIIVSSTAISNFIIPSIEAAVPIRLLRYAFMFAAAFMGMYGLYVAVMAMLLHLSGLRSFGVPYMSPIAPLHREDIKDSLIRLPLWSRQSTTQQPKRVRR
ncbi:spore germination protein [Paenibacillus elgii]